MKKLSLQSKLKFKVVLKKFHQHQVDRCRFFQPFVSKGCGQSSLKTIRDVFDVSGFIVKIKV